MLAPALLAASVFALQADPVLDQKVTFACAASPATTAVGRLTQQTGVQLSASDKIGAEMLILRFKDVPLRTAMDKIAVATTAEWTKTEAGYRLERPGSLVRALEQKQKLERTAWIKKAIAERVKNLAPFNVNTAHAFFDRYKGGLGQRRGDWGREDKKEAQLREQQPGERFATLVLAGFDPASLAGLPSSARIVFSTSPTRMQRPFGGDVGPALQQYVREQNLWSKVSTEQQESWGNGGGDDIVNFSGAGGGWWMDGQAISRPAAKVVMVVNAEWGSDSISLRFKVCDAKGNILAGPNSFLSARGGYPFEDVPATPSTSEPEKQPDGEPGPEIALSPLATELSTLLSSSSEDADGKKPPPISAELKQILLNPEKNEPLAIFPSEPILKAAEAKDVNVAVRVDDDSFVSSTSASGSAGEVLSDMAGQLGSGKLEGKWLTGTPQNPFLSKLESRHGLGLFLRAITRARRIGLDDLAAYAQNVPSYYGTFACQFSSLVCPGGDALTDTNPDWSYLQLYGSLTPTQRDMLLHGNRLALGTLTSRQQDLIAQIIYGSEVGQDQIEESESNTDQAQSARLPEQIYYYGSLVTEPTELLPNGLDPSLSLQMTSVGEAVIFATRKTGDTTNPPELTDPDNIAMYICDMERKDRDPEEPLTSILGYQTGHRQTYELNIALPARCKASGSLADIEMKAGKLFGFDQLPEDFRKKAEANIEEMRKFFKELEQQLDTHRQTGGSTVPPPRL